MTAANPDLPCIPTLPHQDELTTQEAIYQRLRHAIMIGSIEPGVSLTIRGLAEVLEVSSTPIREALRRLSTEKALELLGNRRIVTPSMTLERFDELIALRVVLECHAAISALPYMSEVQIDELERIDQTMDTQISANEHEAIVVNNQRFHAALYKANPNQVVMPAIESIWLQLGPYSRVALSELSVRYKIDHHKAAIEALRARDGKALKSAIENDIKDGSVLGRSHLIKKL